MGRTEASARFHGGYIARLAGAFSLNWFGQQAPGDPDRQREVKVASASIHAITDGESLAEERLYRQIARRLGLRYVDCDARLLIRDLESALISGLAPLAGGTEAVSWLFAPPRHKIADVIDARERFRFPPERVFVTSPRHYRRQVYNAVQDRIAANASFELAKNAPEMSACSASKKPALKLALFLCVAAGACWGPGWIWLIGSLFFGCSSILKLFACAASCESPPPRPPQLPDALLPGYTVLAPLYRESRVLHRLLSCLCKLDYPGIMAQTPQERNRVSPYFPGHARDSHRHNPAPQAG